MRPALRQSSVARALFCTALLNKPAHYIISMLMLSLAHKWTVSPARDLGFALHDVARLLRTYSNQRARELGTTRAQWAVLSRLQRCEGGSRTNWPRRSTSRRSRWATDRQIDRRGPCRAPRRCDRPSRQPSLSHRKSCAGVEGFGSARRGLDGPGDVGGRRIDHPRHARWPHDHESQYQERIDCWSQSK